MPTGKLITNTFPFKFFFHWVQKSISLMKIPINGVIQVQGLYIFGELIFLEIYKKRTRVVMLMMLFN